MATFNKESLMKASQKMKEVSLDGGSVFIRMLSARQVFDMKNKTTGEAPSEETLFELCSISLVDENFAPFMSKEDVSELDMMAINKIVIAIYEFNGLNEQAVSKAKEVLKNNENPKGSI